MPTTHTHTHTQTHIRMHTNACTQKQMQTSMHAQKNAHNTCKHTHTQSPLTSALYDPLKLFPVNIASVLFSQVCVQNLQLLLQNSGHQKRSTFKTLSTFSID
jgi:hypothetical protein